MKRSFRITLCIMIAAAALALFSAAALAAPAAPGTHPEGGACKSHPGALVTLSDIADAAAKRNAGPMRAPALDPAVNDLPLAVIVVGFSDQAYRTDFDWSQEIFRADYSLAEYYTDMSFGQFTFTPVRESSVYGSGGNNNVKDAADDGVIHVSLPVSHDDWTLEYTVLSAKDKATNLSLMQAMLAALQAADAYVDFSAYDVNGDGAITTNEMALAFVFAGYEASSSYGYGHGKTAYLWSHAYKMSDAIDLYNFSFGLPSPDGVTLNDYIAISEQEDDGSQEPISTLAHELGHYLGLPDLYDTNYNTRLEWGKYDVSFLSLMSTGLYGVDPDTGVTVPNSLDPWSRMILGWVEPQLAAATGEYTLTVQNYADNTGYSLLRIPTQNPGEYYLLENRGFAKWDRGLANEYGADHGGIVLWHIDDAMWDAYYDANTMNNTDHRPGVMPLYAESGSNGGYTFIGRNSTVDLLNPFFDRSIWDSRYASLGSTLDLPIYGTGGNADKRSGRTLSGVKLQFLTDAADTMRVKLNPDQHTHNPVLTYVTEPSCTAGGTAYYTCSMCGRHFSDAAGTQEISEPFAVNALGHTQPNSAGQCSRCGAQLVAQEDLCPYCHTHHSGFIGSIVGFFHRIMYFFAHLFGRM